MKFIKYDSTKLVNVNTNQYIIDWDHKVSGPQFLVKQFLKPYWKNSIVLEEFRIPGSLFRIDLINLNKKICIEVSPRKIHNEYNKFMHGGRGGFLKKLQDDAKKMLWAEQSGFIFIELYDEEINNLSEKLFKEKFDIDL